MTIEEVQVAVEILLDAMRQMESPIHITARLGQVVESKQGNEITLVWDVKVDSFGNVTVQKQAA